MEPRGDLEFYPQDHCLDPVENSFKSMINLDECVFKKCCKKFKKKGKKMCKSCPKR